jgi:protein involved in polysaccharide export with SLBB domain
MRYDAVPANMTRSSFFRQQQGPARFKPGDRVRIEVSPYDLTRGRITFRHKG